nr:hypothetical protein [uncultured Brevundimonas sp.]
MAAVAARNGLKLNACHSWLAAHRVFEHDATVGGIGDVDYETQSANPTSGTIPHAGTGNAPAGTEAAPTTQLTNIQRQGLFDKALVSCSQPAAPKAAHGI